MKKSKAISLFLVTGLLGCSHPKQQNRLYLRTDTLGPYTPAAPGYQGYYVFRPFGTYYGGRYIRQGYSNQAVGVTEESVTRGGFGGSEGFHVSS
jgi:hypothetical protein